MPELKNTSTLAERLRHRVPFKDGDREAKAERRACDECGNASGHYVVYEHGKAVLKRCDYCYTAFA
jgi:hypothetical protein